MNLISKTMYNSPCMYNNAYKRIIKPKGAFLHSIGCPCEKAQNIYNNWNKSSATAGVQALIQADGDIWTTLPVYFDTKSAIRNWHGGKNASNDNYIGVEMMEPASIKYTGGANWIETGDGSHTKAHVLSTYKYAVEYFAYLCDGFGWKPLADGVLLSHSEGYRRGIASNHGDVEHLWSKFGLSMNQFRKDVDSQMKGQVNPLYPSITQDSPLGTIRLKYDLNQRNKPSLTHSTVVQVAKKGLVLTVMDKLQSEGMEWYLMKNGTYMSANPYYSSFSSINEDNDHEWVGKVNTTALNVRKGPGTNYEKLAEYPQLGLGNLVLVQGNEKDNKGTLWYRILIAEKYQGYVHSAYLDRA